ncbi:ABC transporter ATP-binding protein [Halomicroarcula sp. GCM10025894]|uniref:ABC transporter ATP-binding protein n=1 Tax=Halomicroarcula sp. GCM10025894 TaxID=3252673 RepID=UPI0036177E8B
MTAAPYLSTSDLTKSYGDVTAVDAVTVEFPDTAVTGLVGPNGSGKTTLIELLLGIERPTLGSVEYGGPEEVRRFGYLPQRPTFRPGFTVAETVDFYAGLVGDDPDRLLANVGLEAVADRPVTGLSGGMTRLLGIAQALAGDPPVVVLDEPASGLDPAMSERIFGVVEDIAAEGRAVVLSSHELPWSNGPPTASPSSNRGGSARREARQSCENRPAGRSTRRSRRCCGGHRRRRSGR